ncbi:MAG TPA: response regulator [Polyangia bacterium]|nr:response regulator [Polyangia bacterium]
MSATEVLGGAEQGVGVTTDEDAPPRVATEPQRLLLIEDDFTLRAHLAELLMQEGYYVGCAADGEEAIRRLQREPLPAAILLDIMLPRVTGVAFREAQMRTSGLRSIPTIAITSIRDSELLQSLGFAAVFRKPIDFETLTQTLARVCPPR